MAVACGRSGTCGCAHVGAGVSRGRIVLVARRLTEAYSACLFFPLLRKCCAMTEVNFFFLHGDGLSHGASAAGCGRVGAGVSRTHRARAYPMLPCFVVIRVLDWTRTCVRCARRHGTFHHTRVFFATCTHQFSIHLIIDKTYPAHTSDGVPRSGSDERQGRVARSATSCSFRFAARPT